MANHIIASIALMQFPKCMHFEYFGMLIIIIITVLRCWLLHMSQPCERNSMTTLNLPNNNPFRSARMVTSKILSFFVCLSDFVVTHSTSRISTQFSCFLFVCCCCFFYFSSALILEGNIFNTFADFHLLPIMRMKPVPFLHNYKQVKRLKRSCFLILYVYLRSSALHHAIFFVFFIFFAPAFVLRH